MISINYFGRLNIVILICPPLQNSGGTCDSKQTTMPTCMLVLDLVWCSTHCKWLFQSQMRTLSMLGLIIVTESHNFHLDKRTAIQPFLCQRSYLSKQSCCRKEHELTYLSGPPVIIAVSRSVPRERKNGALSDREAKSTWKVVSSCFFKVFASFYQASMSVYNSFVHFSQRAWVLDVAWMISKVVYEVWIKTTRNKYIYSDTEARCHYI